MEPWEVAARVSLQKTMTDYTRCVDTGRLDALADLFTDECHYDMGNGAPLTNRGEILRRGEQVRAMFRDSPSFDGRVRHHVTPVSVEFSNPNQAKAVSYFLTMGRLGPDHWGLYRDVLVTVEGRWRFARRVVTVEGHSPQSPAADHP
jgi:hypothetical protein